MNNADYYISILSAASDEHGRPYQVGFFRAHPDIVGYRDADAETLKEYCEMVGLV